MRMRFLICTVCLLSIATSHVAAFSTVDASTAGLVSVSVQRDLPVSPTKAQEAWISFVFEKGGGLPTIVIPQKDGDTSRRLLVPLFAQETITSSTVGDSEASVEYVLTELGPIWSSEIKKDTHLGVVEFTSSPDNNDCCSMTWTSTFTTLQRNGFWKAVTEQLINTASDNLAASLRAPLLYTRTTRLATKEAVPLSKIAEHWVEFCFRSGGGLPVNPPLVVNRGEESGKDTELLRVPPFLREKVISVDTSSECSTVQYRIMNPSLFTYQVYSHLGRVRFYPKQDYIDMVWNVEIRPYRGWEEAVKIFTEAIITMLSRNFASHLAEPNAHVSLRPPRGGRGEQLAQIRKDSWLGGVLDAHLRDQRSTFEQTIAIFQPWTWGRSTDGPGEGAEWTTAEID